ncbi:MAG: hypothetical protein ACD_21C00169G0003 [uncultured bacterium]|nr:MAG: hypothetical protein ACD_21C00169G0003 [uncultured bacterium]
MRVKCIACISFLFFASQIIAAGPVTHAYLAQKWINSQEHFNKQETDSFIRGTLFPDIRYLGILTRKATHYKGITLKALLRDKSPFSRGKKLHSFIDEKREELVVAWKIYDQLKNIPGQKYRSTFLKLLEDEILYREGNWEEVRTALNVVDDSELACNIKKEDIIKWHKIMQLAFYMPPSSEYLLIDKSLPFMIKQVNGKKFIFNIPIEITREWSVILPKLADNKDMQAYVHNLVKQLNDLWTTKKL